MKSLSGFLPVLAIFLSLDYARARPQSNGQPVSGVGIVEKVEKVNLHEKVNSSGSNNRYFLLESYFLHNSTGRKCKVVLNRQHMKSFNVSLEMKSFLKILLLDSAITEMSILADRTQTKNNTNIGRFFEIIDKYRISKPKPPLNYFLVIFKWYLSNCKSLRSKNEDIFSCSCGHFDRKNGSQKNKNQTNESKHCTVFMKLLNNYDTVLILDLNDDSSVCLVLHLKLLDDFPISTTQQDYRQLRPSRKHMNSRNRSKRRIEPPDEGSKEWVPISVSSKSSKVKIRPISGARRKHDDEIVQQFFESSIPALKASFVDKPVLPESLDELILLHTFHDGIIKKNLSVQIGGDDDPLRYPSSYSTTLAAPTIVVNNAIESSSPVYSYPSTSAPSLSTATYPPSYDYPKPTLPTGDVPLEWPFESTRPSNNYGPGINHVSEAPTFVEPVNVPVNFLPSTDDATPLNPLTAFNGQTSSAILVIASPSDDALEDTGGGVVANDAVGGAAGGAGGAGAAGVAGGAATAGVAGAAAAGVAAAGGVAGGVAAGAAGAALGAGALAAAAGAGAVAGAAAGVAAGATAGVAAGAATGIAVGAAAAGGGNNAAGGGIGGGGIGGGGVVGGGGGGGGGIGVTAIDQSGVGAIPATNVVTPSDTLDSDISLMDYVASIFGGVNILNPIGFTFWSMMFAPLSIILTSGLSMFAVLFPWLFPALWFGRSTTGPRSHSWHSHQSPNHYSDTEVENLSDPYIFSYQRDASHSSSIPINRKHVRKRRKRRSLLVV